MTITYPAGKLCAPFRVVHMVRYCHAVTSFIHSDFLCMCCNCMQAQSQHAHNSSITVCCSKSNPHSLAHALIVRIDLTTTPHLATTPHLTSPHHHTSPHNHITVLYTSCSSHLVWYGSATHTGFYGYLNHTTWLYHSQHHLLRLHEFHLVTA